MTTYTYTVTLTVAAIATDTAKVGDKFTATVTHRSRKGYHKVVEQAANGLGLGRCAIADGYMANVVEERLVKEGRLTYNPTIHFDVEVEEVE